MGKKSLLDRLVPGRVVAKRSAELARESRARSAALDEAVEALRAAFPDRGARLAIELEQYAWHAWSARRLEITDGDYGDKPLFGRGCSVCPRSADGTEGAAVFTTYMGHVDGLKDGDYVDTSTQWWTADQWRASENEWGRRVCSRCVETCAALDAAARGTYDLHGASSFPRTGPDPAVADSLRADLSRALAGRAAREPVISWISPLAPPTGRQGCSNHHQGDDRGTVRIGVGDWLCARCVREALRMRP